ncbi:MAG: hypothetical protein ACHQ49_16535, partial [Elusimicrobiota bacterium]
MKTSRILRAAPLALAAVLLTTPVRAAVYELASEWMTISFKDGDKDLLLFTHLPDSDVFLHMKDYLTDASTKTPNIELYVKLLDLHRAPSSAQAPAAPGPVKSLDLVSRPTPYKMLIRFDTLHHHHVIERAPDFSTRDSTTSATITSVFGVQTDHPENFLVLVLPEQPASAAGALSDIELAAVNSLDASQRTALVGQCGGEPGTAASADCWHAKIAELLNGHKGEAPNQGLSEFEQRYIRNRLSKKGFEQFQSLRSSSADGDKLSLASNWHQMIIDQDIAANAAAAVKIVAPAKAPVVAAIVPAVTTTLAVVAVAPQRVPPVPPAVPKMNKPLN